MGTPFVASAFITGGSSGLGYSTARILAKQHPDWLILIVSRSDSQAATKINAELRKLDDKRHDNVMYLPLDCSSRQAIRQFAQSYSSASHPPIQTLILNAGVQVVSGVKYSVDGEELTFATNHTGQALLFFLLQQHLSDDARIIYVSSSTHDPKRPERAPSPKYISAEKCALPDKFDQWDTAFEGRRRYALSKLANILWVHALRKKIETLGKKWTVAAFSPGLMPGTGLARDSPFLLRFIWLYILPYTIPLLRKMIPDTYTPDESGLDLSKLATEKGIVNNIDPDTAYWKHSGPLKSSIDSYDAEKQNDLWDWTVREVAGDMEERERFDGLKS